MNDSFKTLCSICRDVLFIRLYTVDVLLSQSCPSFQAGWDCNVFLHFCAMVLCGLNLPSHARRVPSAQKHPVLIKEGWVELVGTSLYGHNLVFQQRCVICMKLHGHLRNVTLTSRSSHFICNPKCKLFYMGSPGFPILSLM